MYPLVILVFLVHKCQMKNKQKQITEKNVHRNVFHFPYYSQFV